MNTKEKHFTFEDAQRRVINNPRLLPYYKTLIEYDWANEQDHIDWVCTALVSAIVDWAKTIEEV